MNRTSGTQRWTNRELYSWMRINGFWSEQWERLVWQAGLMRYTHKRRSRRVS